MKTVKEYKADYRKNEIPKVLEKFNACMEFSNLSNKDINNAYRYLKKDLTAWVRYARKSDLESGKDFDKIINRYLL